MQVERRDLNRDAPGLELGESSTSESSERSTDAEWRTRRRQVGLLRRRSVACTRSATPTMPFNGVRISWLMLATKVVFARLA